MSICFYCGVQHTNEAVINAFAEDDVEQKTAVEQMDSLIKEEKDKEFKSLLNVKKDSLKLEDTLSTRLEKSLTEAKSSLVKAVKKILSEGKGEYLLTLTPEQLNNYLIEKGLGTALVTLNNAQLDIRDLVVTNIRLFKPSFSVQNVSLFPFLKTTTTESVFNDSILSATSKTLKDSIVTAATTGNASLAIKQLEENLAKATGTQVAEAKLKIAEMNRSLTATSAEAAGLEYFYYSGPKDNITRPFCRKLIGKVVTASDINKLNNGIAGSSALMQGGGYNCRHSWTAVSKEFCDRLNLPILTTAEVKKI